jgi:glutamine synthetase
VATAVNATKAAGVDNVAQTDLLKSLTATITEFQSSLSTLEKALGHHHANGEPYDHAKYARDVILQAMTAVRTLGDKLETMVADDLWPLPTYREMLFIK